MGILSLQEWAYIHTSQTTKITYFKGTHLFSFKENSTPHLRSMIKHVHWTIWCSQMQIFNIKMHNNMRKIQFTKNALVMQWNLSKYAQHIVIYNIHNIWRTWNLYSYAILYNLNKLLGILWFQFGVRIDGKDSDINNLPTQIIIPHLG